MRHRRVLDLATRDVFTSVIQGSAAPVFRDSWGDGEDWVCGHCQTNVLAEDIAEDQVWDVGFQCHHCGQLSVSPSLPPGMALPSRYVFAPSGRYRVDSTVEMRRVAFVGKGAKNKREREAGVRGATFGGSGTESGGHLSSEWLLRAVDDLRSIVGPPLDRLLISDALGQASVTPPIERHPLAAVIDGVRKGTEALRGPEPTVDGRAIVELHGLLAALKRWKGHPLWPKITAALINEYSHSHIVLSSATLLEDVGNGVVLHESAKGRAADLMLVIGPRQCAMVEVKAPKVLRWPTAPISAPRAYEIVERALKKAGTGERGQLAGDSAGLIVIGAFHLSEQDLATLERSATRYLASAAKRNRHKNLAGIAIVAVGATLDAGFNAVGIAERRLSAGLTVRVAKHPSYKGAIQLSTEMPSARSVT